MSLISHVSTLTISMILSQVSYGIPLVLLKYTAMLESFRPHQTGLFNALTNHPMCASVWRTYTKRWLCLYKWHRVSKCNDRLGWLNSQWRKEPLQTHGFLSCWFLSVRWWGGLRIARNMLVCRTISLIGYYTIWKIQIFLLGTVHNLMSGVGR